MPIYKNQSRYVAFQSVLTSGLPNTTVPPTVQLSYDEETVLYNAANQSQILNAGNGCWKIQLTASEMNHDLVTLIATANGCMPTQREIYPEADWTGSRAVKVDNLDTAVSSRSTYAGGDTPGTGTLLSRITSQRSANLDNLDAAVSTRLASAAYSPPPTASQIAGTILSNPANKLATDPAGRVSLDLSQPIPLANADQTVGDALNAARAQGFGPWRLDAGARSLQMFGPDGSTLVHSFTLDSSTSPTQRI